jgi:hypothetical protein
MRDFKEVSDRWTEACQAATATPSRVMVREVVLFNDGWRPVIEASPETHALLRESFRLRHGVIGLPKTKDFEASAGKPLIQRHLGALSEHAVFLVYLPEQSALQ